MKGEQEYKWHLKIIDSGSFSWEYCHIQLKKEDTWTCIWSLVKTVYYQKPTHKHIKFRWNNNNKKDKMSVSWIMQVFCLPMQKNKTRISNPKTLDYFNISLLCYLFIWVLNVLSKYQRQGECHSLCNGYITF